MKYKIFVIFLAFFLFNCAVKTPKEAIDAYEAIEKLDLAIKSGTDPINYNRLLVEAKLAVNKARLTLPFVTEDISDDSFNRNDPEKRLMILNASLEKAVQAFEDAKTIISITSSTSEIYYTEDGNRIMKRYGISKDVTNPKEIVDRIWGKGSLYTSKASLHLRG